MDFEIIGEIRNIELIARGSGIHDRARLRKHYGRGHWRKMKGLATVCLTDGTVRTPDLSLVRSPRHRTERSQDQIPLAGLAMKRKATKTSHFAVCINNTGYKASLEVGKLYRVIPDEQAALHGYVRVVDESGEDYRYAVDRFFPLEVPQALADALQIVGIEPDRNALRCGAHLSSDVLPRLMRLPGRSRVAHGRSLPG
jgi:hypothetical protein